MSKTYLRALLLAAISSGIAMAQEPPPPPPPPPPQKAEDRPPKPDVQKQRSFIQEQARRAQEKAREQARRAQEQAASALQKHADELVKQAEKLGDDHPEVREQLRAMKQMERALVESMKSVDVEIAGADTIGATAGEEIRVDVDENGVVREERVIDENGERRVERRVWQGERPGPWGDRPRMNADEVRALREFREKVERLRRTDDEQERGKLLEEIRASLSKQLDRDLQQREEELHAIEQRLENLRTQLVESRENREAKVDSLMKMIENPRNGMGLSREWMDAILQGRAGGAEGDMMPPGNGSDAFNFRYTLPGINFFDGGAMAESSATAGGSSDVQSFRTEIRKRLSRGPQPTDDDRADFDWEEEKGELDRDDFGTSVDEDDSEDDASEESSE